MSSDDKDKTGLEAFLSEHIKVVVVTDKPEPKRCSLCNDVVTGVHRSHADGQFTCESCLWDGVSI